MWWRRKENLKTMMVVKDGKKHDRGGMVENRRQQSRGCVEERKGDDRNCACNDREEKTA